MYNYFDLDYVRSNTDSVEVCRDVSWLRGYHYESLQFLEFSPDSGRCSGLLMTNFTTHHSREMGSFYVQDSPRTPRKATRVLG